MTLETAKLLKENGWSQSRSKFYHDTKLKKIAWCGDIQLAPVDFGDRYIANPSLEELLAVMPDTLRVKQDVVLLVLAYLQREITDLGNELALLWLQLKKEKLIT